MLYKDERELLGGASLYIFPSYILLLNTFTSYIICSFIHSHSYSPVPTTPLQSHIANPACKKSKVAQYADIAHLGQIILAHVCECHFRTRMLMSLPRTYAKMIWPKCAKVAYYATLNFLQVGIWLFQQKKKGKI